MSGNNPDLRYLERTPAGAEYVSQLSAQVSDRRTRSAFQDLVLGITPPGAALFDFGAGPGIDARFFAERGFTIDAYDVDPRMRGFFADHCADLIESGRVTLGCSTYQEFLSCRAADGKRRTDLVISNFAPLNLVDDLRQLFMKFDALTGPNGRVLASVLSPYFIGDIRSRLWWRGALRLWRDGQLFMPGPQAPYYKRLLSHFRRVSAPHFRLSRVFHGIDLRHDGPFAWLHIATCRYMFLLFEKTH
jgi:SAM-dependent methyltransferase